MKIRRSRSSARANVRRAAWFATALSLLGSLPGASSRAAAADAENTWDGQHSRAWWLLDDEWNNGRQSAFAPWNNTGAPNFFWSNASVPNSFALSSPGPITSVAGQDLTVDHGTTLSISADDTWSSIYVGNVGNGTINQTAGTLRTSLNVILGANNSTGFYNLSGGSLTANTFLSVGELGRGGTNGAGTFRQTGGSLYAGTVQIGFSDSLFFLSGLSSLVMADTVSVGYFGTGNLGISAGTFKANRVSVGLEGTGTVNMTGGLMSIGQLAVGDQPATYNGAYAVGTFTQSGGSVDTAGQALLVARGAPTIQGTYNLGGAGSTLTTGQVYVGDGGTGVFNMSAGSLSAQGIYVGNAVSIATSPYPGTPVATFAGNGTFTQTGGSVSTNGKMLVLGNQAGTTGTYNLSGSGSTLTTGIIEVGFGGTGVFNMSGGSLQAGDIFVGLGGTGTFNQSGGSVTTNGANLALGGSGGTGTYALGGTGTLNAENVYLGNGSIGTFNLDGGTATISSFLMPDGSTATLNFNGGTLRPSAGNTNFFFGGPVTSNVRNGGAKIDTAGFDIAIDQPLVHSTIGGDSATDGGLSKSGAGTLTLAGTNTYTGGTTISAGTLQIGSGGTAGTPLGSGAVIDNGVLAFNRSDNLTVANAISGTGRLNLLGTGTVTLTGNNTLSGLFALGDGTLRLGSAGALGSTALISFDGGVLQYSASNTTDYSGRFVLVGSNQVYSIDTNGQNVTLATGLRAAGGSGGGLLKGGAGTLTLTGTNTYTGNTTVTNGTLAIPSGSLGVSGSTANFTVDGSAGNAATATLSGTGSVTARNVSVGNGTAGTFNLNGGTLTAASITGGGGVFNFNGGVLKAAAAGTGFFQNLAAGNVRNGGAKIDTNGFDVTAAEPLVHSTIGGDSTTDGGLTKSGAGTLTLTSNNTWTGATTISAGTLQIGNGGTTGTLGTSTGAITDNGTLAFNRSDNLTLANAVSGTGGLTKLGAGTLTLSGANTFSGNTSISAGTLAITAGRLGTAAATLTVDGPAGSAANGTLAGPAIVSLSTFRAGDNATGTFTQSGGTVTVANALTAGYAAGSTGTYNLSGGSIDARTLQVGRAGTGTFNQSGGNMTATQNFVIGGMSTGIGTYNLSGSSATLDAGLLQLGTGGSATFNLDGGTLTVDNVAMTAGSVGTFNFNGGVLRPSRGVTTFLQGLTAANVRGGGAKIDTAGANITIAQPLVHSTISGDNATDGGLTKLGAGTLTLTGVNTYTGNTNVNAGTLTIASSGRVGVAGSTANFNVNGNAATTLSGTGSLSTGNAFVNNGSLTQTGGSFTTNGNQLYVGNNPGNTGTYNLSGAGSTLSVRDIIVGNNGGAGTFNQSGGSVTLAAGGVTFVGLDTAASSIWNMSGGSLSASDMYIGYNGTGDGGHGHGTFTQTGGSVTTNGYILYLGTNADTTGTYNLSGANSTLSTAGVAVGYGGAGVFNLDGGTLSTGYVGFNGGTGTFNFNGGALKPSASRTDFFQGLTTANVRAGGALIDTAGFDVTIAQPLVHDSTAGAAATDGGLTKLGTGTLTFNGPAANTYTGDTLVNAGTLVLAKGSAGAANNFGSAMAGNLIVNSGGTARYGANSQVGDNRNITVNVGGTLNLNGFAESLTNLTVNGGTITTGTGYLNVRGAFAADSSATSSYAGNLHLEAATANAARDVSVASGGTFTLSAVVGNGDNGLATQLNKTGAGTLVLSGNNTYTGATTINAGTLFAANTSGSATGTGAVVVNSGGTLAGSGTIGGPVTVASGGMLDPGTLAVSRLTLGSTLSLQNGSNLSIKLGGVSAGSYDQVFVSGALTLGGGLNVTVVNGFTLTPGQTFTIFDNTGMVATSGTFANVIGTLYTNEAGNTFTVNYAANVDGGTVANDVTLTYVGVNVPEPRTWVWLGLGAGGLLFVVRRRSRRVTA